ncbi:NAD(P)-dependent dehydrogenase (short-subunit alcohol dehydrogenase family) [Algoriphagus iocasae]|uniref:NAD(P)-dependent dehydrogenase (Short-subunit alcohol dehydrogenase family) n=1 Tax=Algoriphagus iocasae TaxID=1836499 RepID=A0A841MUF4_9BACT|nr:3-ketoacyl-ACP reductase [Algoriphagus iocasae]MBB6325651.1 NAD(P)-dependent dehydrogenase (short-subunit alcohol dehydrogenase family) [Algoriphagus iocasae]
MKPVALVTGGSRGIGFGIAKKLAEAGYDLGINGIRPESDAQANLEELKSLGSKVVYLQGNIAEKTDRKSIIEGLKAHFGKIDVLVNNAGVAPRVRCDVLEVTEEDYDHLMNINEKGTFFLTQEIAKWMLDLKATNPAAQISIINITSVSAELASPKRAAYCMSKASLSMLSKTMAVRMAPHGIAVYEIRPGFVDTDMIEKVRETYLTLVQEGATLEPRIGKPEDIGQVVATLVKGDLPYASGQIINVDGGLTIARM